MCQNHYHFDGDQEIDIENYDYEDADYYTKTFKSSMKSNNRIKVGKPSGALLDYLISLNF